MTVPPVTPLPDAEAVAVAWLIHHAGFPAGTDLRGWTAGHTRAVVTRTGGVPRIPMWVDEARLDIDVYGPDKATTHDLAQTARAALHDMPTGSHERAVVSAVHDDTGLAWLPDPDTGAARYVFAVRIITHPHP